MPDVFRRNQVRDYMSHEHNPTIQAVLRPAAAAAYIGLTQSTLAKRRLRGDGPVFVKLGAKAVGYRLEDLDAWLAENVRRSTSDPGLAGGSQ